MYFFTFNITIDFRECFVTEQTRSPFGKAWHCDMEIHLETEFCFMTELCSYHETELPRNISVSVATYLFWMWNCYIIYLFWTWVEYTRLSYISYRKCFCLISKELSGSWMLEPRFLSRRLTTKLFFLKIRATCDYSVTYGDCTSTFIDQSLSRRTGDSTWLSDSKTLVEAIAMSLIFWVTGVAYSWSHHRIELFNNIFHSFWILCQTFRTWVCVPLLISWC